MARPKVALKSNSGNKDTRPVIGEDSTGKSVHVGDTVDHLKKEKREKGYVGGWVTDDLMPYKGEPAAKVLYPVGPVLPSRFSQMIVTVVNTTPKMVQAAFQLVQAQRAALMKATQVKKEKAFLKAYPRDKRHLTPQKVWSYHPETSGGLPSLGKKR